MLQTSLDELWHSKELQLIQNIKKCDLQECNGCEFKKDCIRCPGLAYLEDVNMLGCSSTAKAMAAVRYTISGKEDLQHEKRVQKTCV